MFSIGWKDRLWLGPAEVIDQESSVVLIRYCGALIRAHCSRVERRTPASSDDMHGNEELSKRPSSVCEPPEGKATVPSRSPKPLFCQR